MSEDIRCFVKCVRDIFERSPIGVNRASIEISLSRIMTGNEIVKWRQRSIASTARSSVNANEITSGTVSTK